MNDNFWSCVESCEHEWSDYDDGGNCANEYCQWNERRCKKCKVYDVSCQCGFEVGQSGWPRSRWRKLEHANGWY